MAGFARAFGIVLVVAGFAFASVGAPEGAGGARAAWKRDASPSDLVGTGSLAPSLHAYGPVTIVNGQDFGGEPGIDVAPDGTIYENAPSGLGGAGGSWLYKSTDGGSSWSKCTITTGPGGGDSAVAIGPDGVIAMNDLYLGSITFYVSRDRCATWIPNPVSTPVPVGDRQWVDYGHAPCEYFQSWNQIPTGIHLQRTKDCGLTWADWQATGAMDLIGNLVVDHSGVTKNVYQFFTNGGAIHVTIGRVATSLAGDSMTFTTRTVAPAITGHVTLDSFPAGAVDAAGNVHVVWQDMVKTGKGKSATFDSRIAYAYSTNGGTTWSAPRIVSSGGSNVFPWIDAGAAGKVNAAWYHSTKAGNPNNVAGPWYVSVGQSTALGGAWTETRPTPTSIHNDVICTSGTGCSGDDRDLLDFFELAHDAAGLAVIAFAKDTDANGNGNGDPRNAFVRQTSGTGIL